MSGRYGRYFAALGGLILALAATQAVGEVVSGKQADRPAQQQADAKRAPSPTTKAAPAAPPPQRIEPANRSTKPDDLRGGQHTDHAKNSDGFWNGRFTDWAIVFLTFGLLVVGAVQAAIYLAQSRVMGHALRATIKSNIVARKAANAAIKAADVAERSMTVVERAYVFGGIEKLVYEQAGSIKFDFLVTNAGKTPARVRQMLYGVFPPNAQGLIVWPTDRDYSGADTHTTDTIFGAGERGALFALAGNPPVGIVYGEITYSDIFDVEHKSRFCLHYDFTKGEVRTVGNDSWNEYD